MQNKKIMQTVVFQKSDEERLQKGETAKLGQMFLIEEKAQLNEK